MSASTGEPLFTDIWVFYHPEKVLPKLIFLPKIIPPEHFSPKKVPDRQFQSQKRASHLLATAIPGSPPFPRKVFWNLRLRPGWRKKSLGTNLFQWRLFGHGKVTRSYPSYWSYFTIPGHFRAHKSTAPVVPQSWTFNVVELVLLQSRSRWVP